MSVFDFLGKMINGEPVFDTAKQSGTPPSTPLQTATATSDVTRTSTGNKVMPAVHIRRVKSSRHGGKMLSYVWVQNDSSFTVVLKKLYVLHQSSPLNYHLAPGQGREVLAYKGSVARDEHEHHAYLDFYIEQNGDYFQQEFDVEFDRQADGTYLIEEFHPEHHVRDT